LGGKNINYPSIQAQFYSAVWKILPGAYLDTADNLTAYLNTVGPYPAYNWTKIVPYA
jgi:hypothetical protein